MEGRGFGAVLEIGRAPDAALMEKMKPLSRKPLAQFSTAWQPLPQRLTEIAATKPALAPPTGMVAIPAGAFDFAVQGIEVEGGDAEGVAQGTIEFYKFLASVWPDDPESIEAMQEWFGYCLLTDTRQQKIALLIGPPRSGRGTIARLMSALIGPENVAGPRLSALATNFGLEPLVGKPLATIGDARLSGRTDTGIIVEALLSISGEDTITIDRKHKAPWTGKLPTRLMLLSNELPRLPDQSGALASRFLVWRFTRSFLRNEDLGLDARLAG